MIEYWGTPFPMSPRQYSSTPSYQIFFSVAPFSRMKAPMSFFETGAAHVRVDLRRRDVRVTQHGLNGAQIGATFQ